MQTLTNTLPAINKTVQHIGFVMMAYASTFGMVELPGHNENRVTAHVQPAFVFATEHNSGPEANTQRREREETGPHYTSYSAAMRTPGRTGTV